MMEEGEARIIPLSRQKDHTIHPPVSVPNFCMYNTYKYISTYIVNGIRPAISVDNLINLGNR